MMMVSMSSRFTVNSGKVKSPPSSAKEDGGGNNS
jgi:hypothetical protein